MRMGFACVEGCLNSTLRLFEDDDGASGVCASGVCACRFNFIPNSVIIHIYEVNATTALILGGQVVD